MRQKKNEWLSKANPLGTFLCLLVNFPILVFALPSALAFGRKSLK